MVVRWLLVIAGWALLNLQICAAANGGLVLPSGAAGQEAAEGASAQVGKLNSPCKADDDCKTVESAHCDLEQKKCQCKPATPVKIGQDACLEARQLNQTCTKSEQCQHTNKGATCKSNICECGQNFKLITNNGTHYCKASSENKAHPPEESKVDLTMILVLVSLAVMFIIMCIVLRMFSKAQFREQRTIFNSPRLMKKSLSKARADRRASHTSVGSRAGSRAGSRHASIQSGLNLGGSPKGSRESITLPNSSSTKNLAAPIAEDDDLVEKIGSSHGSPHVAITSDNNIASV